MQQPDTKDSPEPKGATTGRCGGSGKKDEDDAPKQSNFRSGSAGMLDFFLPMSESIKSFMVTTVSITKLNM